MTQRDRMYTAEIVLLTVHQSRACQVIRNYILYISCINCPVMFGTYIQFIRYFITILRELCEKCTIFL